MNPSKRRPAGILRLAAVLLLACVYACDDMRDKDEPAGGTVTSESGTAELYVLCEGLFNLNNSTLARHTFGDGKTETGYFRRMNSRGLGDTANDMAIYGSKLYVVVTVSSQVEVIDLPTGKSLKRIPMLAEDGSSRQPRYIAFDKGKAYVCSFDGTVARVDTTSLSVEAYTPAGRNPDGICALNGKLYVSNSGSLDSPNYDNTVSVIDIPSFGEVKKITVGDNPGRIEADSYGNIYVTARGNLTEANYKWVRIDSATGEVSGALNEEVLNFTIHGDLAYLYSYDYNLKSARIKVYNIRKDDVERDNFITDGTAVTTPYTIRANPYSGNIYMTDVYDYQVVGDVLCFNPAGELQYRIHGLGINPNCVVFSAVSSQPGDGGTPGEPDAVFASKVWEYVPAPSQFMNTVTTAYREGFAPGDVLNYATTRIQSRSLLTLGGFGGYIVLGFDEPVPNVKGSYDFRIYGNSYGNAGSGGGSSEPGIVLVSKDTNGNGLPDDEWYELAGSEYHSEKVVRNYEITYYRPSTPLGDVKWSDNRGHTGSIPRNEAHTDNSYYPQWVESNEMTFRGNRLPDNGVEDGTGNWVQYPFAWGYADNQPNDSEHSRFDIGRAVDGDGNPVELDEIHFVKIYTAVNQVCGWLGETSTDITGVERCN